MDLLLNNHIFAYGSDFIEDGCEFRQTILYQYDVNEILAINEQTILKLYNLYVHPNKKYITYKDCIDLI